VAPPPKRDREVYFVGAGLSKAVGLPNTAELLDGVFALARRKRRWGTSEKLPKRVLEAFKYFYPDARHKGYQPDVVDFFSVLRTSVDVGAGFSGGFHDAPDLYRSLKFAIAHLLTERLRDVDTTLKAGHEYLEKVVQPGNIVVTLNWDLVIERYAQLREVPIRHAGHDDHSLVIHKLHGSVDWCGGPSMASSYADSNYAVLSERLFSPTTYRMSLPPKAEREGAVFRIRALENWGGAWRQITSRANDLHMVTMARGKAGDLGPLQSIWRDAYGAISRAQNLEIVGYSLPPDDIEIRTILRAGIRRGRETIRVTVRNPAPDVHERVRRTCCKAQTRSIKPLRRSR
jgi:hypothetical protein